MWRPLPRAVGSDAANLPLSLEEENWAWGLEGQAACVGLYMYVPIIHVQEPGLTCFSGHSMAGRRPWG